MKNNFSLDEFAQGALLEQFNQAAQEVAENIADPNTSAKAKRKIIMELAFKPGEDRELVPVNVNVRTALAPVKGFASRVIIGRNDKGKIESKEYVSNYNQLQIDETGQLKTNDGAIAKLQVVGK